MNDLAKKLLHCMKLGLSMHEMAYLTDFDPDTAWRNTEFRKAHHQARCEVNRRFINLNYEGRTDVLPHTQERLDT